MKGSRAVEKKSDWKRHALRLVSCWKSKISFHRAVRPNTFLKSMPMKFLSTEKHENRRGKKLYPGDEVVVADQGKFVMKTGEWYATSKPQTEEFSQLSRNKAWIFTEYQRFDWRKRSRKDESAWINLCSGNDEKSQNDEWSRMIEFFRKKCFSWGNSWKKRPEIYACRCLLSKKGKTARVNSLETPRLSQYIGKLNVILFSPEDLSLVKGSPAVRRRFIDMEFGQIDAVYLYELTRYRTILRDRNVYLKQLQTKRSTDRVYLEVLTEQLAKAGRKIILKRLEFLEELWKTMQKSCMQT